MHLCSKLQSKLLSDDVTHLVPGSDRDHRFPLALRSPIPPSGCTISTRLVDCWSFLFVFFSIYFQSRAESQRQRDKRLPPQGERRLSNSAKVKQFSVFSLSSFRSHDATVAADGAPRRCCNPTDTGELQQQRISYSSLCLRTTTSQHQIFVWHRRGGSPGEVQTVAGMRMRMRRRFRMHAADDKTDAWGVIAPVKHVAPAGTIKEPG